MAFSGADTVTVLPKHGFEIPKFHVILLSSASCVAGVIGVEPPPQAQQLSLELHPSVGVEQVKTPILRPSQLSSVSSHEPVTTPGN